MSLLTVSAPSGSSPCRKTLTTGPGPGSSLTRWSSKVSAGALQQALDRIPELEGVPHNGYVHPRSGARGPYQIKAIALKDVRRITGRHYTIADCHDRKKSREMAAIILRHYCGSNASLGDYLRTWAAGHIGMHRGRGYEYVNKLKG